MPGKFSIIVAACIPLLLAEVYTGWPFDAKEAARRQAETARQLAVRVHSTLDLGNNVALKLVVIPAGKFMLGSPETEMSSSPAGARRTNESPLHEVTITRPFFVSEYKITQQQFQQIMGTNPSKFPGKDNPVDAVTWDEAERFCEKASKKLNRQIHLPTEAQWEYAARAGTATRYTFGDEESRVGDHAWFRENSKGMTHSVGQKSPNAWGLFDVHGLLWEYCSDFYAESYAGAKSTDPRGPESGTSHATRGGTYGSRPPFVRSAIRIASPAADGGKDLLSHFGFRVSVEIQREPKRE